MRRQPVHTVYGGAHLFRRDTARKLGAIALRSLEACAEALGMTEAIRGRVAEKLAHEPVEDYRIDFEDGFGRRSGAEEDAAAERAAAEVAEGMAADTLPPFLGIRIKPLRAASRARNLRTLEIFFRALERVPANFAVTLPKVTGPEQVAELADVIGERAAIELMIETPEAIFAPDGGCALPRLIAAARGRCRGAHLGAYDYTAALGITAAHQHLMHPACDFARHMMQASLAGTGVWLSDGATNILPLAGREAQAWKLHFDHVRHALRNGFYQGWDLHPAQLPARYAAVYAFFLEGLEEAGARLRNFAKEARATRVGEIFDDAASGLGLINYFVRALDCGAITEQEAVAQSGLTLEELRQPQWR